MTRRAFAFATLRPGLILAFFGLLIGNSHADIDASDVSPGRWTSLSDTIKYAVVFTTIHSSEGPRKVIRVFVKNISGATQGIPWTSSDGGTGILIYYLDESSKKHRIHDVYHAKPAYPGEPPEEKLKERLKEELADSGSASIRDIAPGATFSEVVVLSPSDLSLIKAQPVMVNFEIINPNTSKSLAVESKPVKLSELSAGEK